MTWSVTAKITTMMISRLLSKHHAKFDAADLGLSEDKGDEKRKADDGHLCGRSPH